MSIKIIMIMLRVKKSIFSGPQKGPAERGHFDKRQKSSKSVKNIFDTFRHFRAGQKKRQKVSKIISTLFDNFRAAPVFRPFFGGLRVLFLGDSENGIGGPVPFGQSP